MYGFLKVPSSATLAEREKYKSYMCTLCDSLHENYGIKGRLFVNYDCTTLALLVGSLSSADSLEDKLLSRPLSKSLPLCVFKHRKSPKAFKFISAVSIMLGYSEFLDKAIEDNKRVPRWVAKLSDSASQHLSAYGLDKSFFKNKLQEQHRLEKEGCQDIELLSIPTSEILSRIFGVIGELTAKPEYSTTLRELGFELGRRIYVYDGLLDYRKDLRTDSFNCIHVCYSKEKSAGITNYGICIPEEIPKEAYNFIKATRCNISSILDRINLKNDSLLKRIFFQDFGEGRIGRAASSGGDITLRRGIYSMLKPMYSMLSRGLVFQRGSASCEGGEPVHEAGPCEKGRPVREPRCCEEGKPVREEGCCESGTPVRKAGPCEEGEPVRKGGSCE